MIIKPPRNPRPSEDVVGPNHPATVDPDFNNPYRNKGGDVGGAGEVTGRKPGRIPNPWD